MSENLDLFVEGIGHLRPSKAAIHRHAAPRKNDAPRRGRKKRKPKHVEPLDFFIEDEACVQLLLSVVDIPGPVLEPACGIGTTARGLAAAGLDVTTSDIVDRGYPGCTAGVDFTLRGSYAPGSFASVVCNPPYYSGRGVLAFLLNGLLVARERVALLVPLPYLASQGRFALFSRTPISHVIVCSKRPSMPPGSLFLAGKCKRKGGKEDYAWLVFSHAHVGPPTIHWCMAGGASKETRNMETTLAQWGW